MAVVGYERVPDGSACALCNIAAGQRYTSGNLMPIHDRCGCGVMPLTEDDLYDPRVGDAGELRSGKEYMPDGNWQLVEGAIRGTVVKKSDEFVMLNAGTEKVPRWIQGTRLDIRKPVVQLKREATSRFALVDVKTLPAVEVKLKGEKVRQALVQPRAGFSPEQRQAVLDYTGGEGKGPIAEEMNRSLRQGAGNAHADVRDLLDAAIESTEGLPEAGMVFRGTKVKFSRQLKPGAVLEDNGFMSTSSSRAQANNFAAFSKGDIFEIVLPRGTKALDINEAAGSGFGSEREVLLPRGTKMVVESIKPGEFGRRIIRARVILDA